MFIHVLHLTLSSLLSLGVVAVAFAPLSTLQPGTKQKIILAIGLISYSGLLATTIRSKIFSTSQMEASSMINLSRPDCKYITEIKYPALTPIDSLHHRNYWPAKTHDSALIVFNSNKEEGASYYLASLAEQICRRKQPVVYLKLTRSIQSEQQFLALLNAESLPTLKRHICHTQTFMLVDNFEFISDQSVFVKILKELVQQCNVSLVLNSQKSESVNGLLEMWRKIESLSWKVFPFQLRRWAGPTQYDLFHILELHGEEIKALQRVQLQENINFRVISDVIAKITDGN